MNQKTASEYELSLKSIETENYIDRIFFRPLGFWIAKLLRNSGITPNMVTVISIFIGASAGPLFYYNSLRLTLLGIFCLVFANLLDCVDGQLARLTGIKSKIGRVLDGFAGNIWFILIYVFLALRLKNEYGSYLFFIPAVLSGFSHIVQANITDYYKTLHLYFVSREKGSEFQNSNEIRTQHKNMKRGFGKMLFFIYMGYTLLQEAITPRLQGMLKQLHTRYGNDIPENIRMDFRRKSSRIMKRYIDFMTFNGRVFLLFLAVLSNEVWIYFFFEIIILNIFLLLSIYKHEHICTTFTER